MANVRDRDIRHYGVDLIPWLDYMGRNYAFSQYFVYWTDFETDNNIQGWKTHISINTLEEHKFIVDHLLPCLRHYKLTHKMVHPGLMDKFNSLDLQKGKILTIYDPTLSFLRYVTPKVLDFLVEPAKIVVPTDKHLGGRVFVRYTGYKTDLIKNPVTGEIETMERLEGNYKPNWIEDLPDLGTLIQETRSQTSLKS
jgi:hypothetical protein